MECLVKVEQGILEGSICKTYKGKQYYSFEGIPYAKPPVGKLRFRSPEEPENWLGVRNAKKPGNKCAQLSPFGKGVLEGSEDCLYLNVYTPMLPADKIIKLPVLFFVHGGRLAMGYGNYYKPDYYIEEDVILVTINYRLNIFGFLCLHTPEVPGNAGFKDSVMALKWVNRNIEHFNGDRNNITAFGESAGAAITTSFLISKMADGLFSKIICQSGTVISDLCIDKRDPVEIARTLATYLGENIQDTDKLYDLFINASTEDLVNAFTSGDISQPPSVINTFCAPVVEKRFDKINAFCDESPKIIIQENRHKKVPILATVQSQEGALFLQEHINYEDYLQYFIPRFLCIEPDSQKGLKFINQLKQYYFDKSSNNDKKVQYLNLLSDHYFNRDMFLFVEALVKFQKNVFLCRFDYCGNMNTRVMKNLGVKGATHGDLIQYQFYRENKLTVATKKDLEVAEILKDAWCNFAKTGTPNLEKHNIDWQPYDLENKSCLNIEDDITVKSFPNYDRIKFWFELVTEKSKL